MFVNTNLLSLKCLLFFFFGGMGCLFPLLYMHGHAVGLTSGEVHIVAIVAPLVAMLGPLLVSPLADRFGATSGQNNGRSMRMMLALAMVLSAVCYALLMCVPTVTRLEPRLPAVSFACHPNGAVILQERCMEPTCYQWTEEKTGALQLSNCRYDCHTSIDPEELDATAIPDVSQENATISDDITGGDSETDDYGLEDGSGFDSPIEADPTFSDSGNRKRRQDVSQGSSDPPHLCYRNLNQKVMCDVYTEFTEGITFNTSLRQTNTSDEDKWCQYPLSGEFSCRIPATLLDTSGPSSCRVICDVDDPYTAAGSVLAQTKCRQMIGDPDVTFWSYLLVRSVADIFPTAAVALLDAAVVIATRETSIGRGDLGRELAWASIGFATFSPIFCFLTSIVSVEEGPSYFILFTAFAVLMIISTLIVLFSTSMPLSPPEWWWHARGMRITDAKRCGAEIAALIIVLILLGIFWSSMDFVLPFFLTQMNGSWLLMGLTLTAGALPAVPFLWNAEKVVDYCGHSNLLITAFTFYIIRFTGLSFLTNPWWTLLFEALEVFTLSLMWVTTILYFRHLMPRHLTAAGQGIAVVAHFCIGRCLGAVVGGAMVHTHILEYFRISAIAAAVIASLYFIIYHCCLKPCCLANQGANQRHPDAPVQGPTTNGTYTPLRVYHNGRGQKGNFRY